MKQDEQAVDQTQGTDAEVKDPVKDQEPAGEEKKEVASEEQTADAAEAENADAKDSEEVSQKYMRLMADFQNYKRRVEKEKSEIYDFANQKILAELLVVLDNFERALAQDCADEAFQKGMDMIFKQFREVLEKSGLEEIEAQGKEFDPNLHHAVLTDSNEDYESGVITEVLQKGYRLHDKVVRPAMVKVNQ